MVRRDDGRGTRAELFAIALHRSLRAVVWFSAIGRGGRLTYWCVVPVIYPGLAARLVLSLVACPQSRSFFSIVDDDPAGEINDLLALSAGRLVL